MDRAEDVPDAETLSIAKLDEAVARGEAACAAFHFNRDLFFHQLIVGYTLWIVESASSVAVLLKHDRVSDSKTLLRAMLECYVDLDLLKQDRAHIWNIQFDFCTRIIRQLEQAKSGNPFAAAIAEKIDTVAEMTEWQRKKAKVYALGGRSINTEQKFTRLGLKNDYEVVYRSLSQSAHSTFAGIVARSFEIDPKKQDFQITLYRSPDQQSMVATIDLAINLINHCTNIAAEMLSEVTHPSSAPR